MTRRFFGVEKGLDIFQENGDLQVRIISGSAAPNGLGDQSAAPIGSVYLRSGTGELYQKILNNGNSGDWQLNGASAAMIGTWRPEAVVAVTNESVSPGTRDMVASPFSDDEGTAIAIGDFVVGKYVIVDADGSPALLEITAVSGDDVTFAAAANPLVEDDTFVAKHYLPDSPDGQEKEAIVNYNGSVIIKLSDINWNFADGISMAAGYTAQNGSVSSSDSVNSAIQKLDGNQQDLISLSGVAQGEVDLGAFSGATIPDDQTIKQALQSLETAYEETDENVDDLISLSGVAENSVDLGTFTGSTIPDSSTVKGALQALETELESVDSDLQETKGDVDDLILLSGVAENAQNFGSFTGDSLADNQNAKQLFQTIEVLLEQMRGVQVTGITTAATVDSVPHASVKTIKWLVECFEEATPANRSCFEIYAATDGSSVDDTQYAKLKLGANFNLTISVDISGADMRLRAASTSAGVTVTARRIEVIKSVL
jgi:hypothetical protein